MSIRDGVRWSFLAPWSIGGQILGILGLDGFLSWNPIGLVASQELGEQGLPLCEASDDLKMLAQCT